MSSSTYVAFEESHEEAAGGVRELWSHWNVPISDHLHFLNLVLVLQLERIDSTQHFVDHQSL